MILILFLVSSSVAKINNVCKTYSDYATKRVNPDCWYNPDVNALPPEIVARQGFPFRSYEITTEDGHILGLFRIPYNEKSFGKKRQPIYLRHGMGVCSHVWYDHGPRSLAYALSNEGYDVWMANTRGTRYSLRHLTYTTKDPRFWNFSWTEVGLYDVSANLKFIHKKTGQKIICIGYSMGTTASFVYSIEKTKEAHDMIKGVVSLAPGAYYTQFRSILKYLVPFREEIMDIAELLGIYGLGQRWPGQKTLLSKICNVYPLNKICVEIAFLILGFDYEELLPEDLPIFFYGFPDGSSLYSVYHYLQIIGNGGRFQKFDYGYLGNLRKYGSLKAPDYDVAKIDLCVHLFYGSEDYITNPPDVQLLHRNLKCSTLNEISVNGTIGYNHIDYIYGKSVESAMYPILFRRMTEIFENGA